MRRRGAKVYDGEAAVALRAMQQAAREVRRVVDGGDTAYLTLIARLHRQGPAEAPRDPEGPSLLIQP
jgi:hypothetical protein